MCDARLMRLYLGGQVTLCGHFMGVLFGLWLGWFCTCVISCIAVVLAPDASSSINMVRVCVCVCVCVLFLKKKGEGQFKTC